MQPVLPDPMLPGPIPPKRTSGGKVALIVGIVTLVLIAAVAAGVGAFRAYRLQQEQTAKQLEHERNRLHAGSERDATQPIEDTSYRFRIDPPGEGWKTLTNKEVARLNPDALGAMMFIGENAQSAWLMVFCERRPEPNLESFITRLPRYVSIQIADDVKPEVTQTSFKGMPAARLSVDGSIIGRPTSMVALAFASGDHVYSIIAHGLKPSEATTRRLDLAVNAVTVTPGAIVERAPPALVDSQGVGWRSKGGVFESPASGLRIKANGWCRTVGGRLAHGNFMRSEASIACTKPSLVISVTPWQEPKVDANWISEIGRAAASGYTPTGEQLQTRYHDKDVPLFVGHSEDGDEVLGAALDVGDGLVAQLLISYAPTSRKTIVAELEAVLASIEHLDPAGREKLRRELASQPHTTLIAPAGVYRSGRYIDFEHGLSWLTPRDASFRVRIGADAANTIAGAHFWANDPGADLEIFLRVIQAPARNFHDNIVQDVNHGQAPSSKQPPLSWGITEAEVTLLAETDNNRNNTLVATAIVRGIGYRAEAYIPGSFGDAGINRARAALSQFSFAAAAKPAVTKTDAGIKEARLGYSLWLPDDLPQADKVDLTEGGTYQWAKGNRMVGVVTIALGEGDNDMLIDIMLQSMASVMSEGATGPIQHSKSTLAGQPARRLIIPQRPWDIEVRQISHHGVVHIVMVLLKDNDKELVFKRFALAAG